jgi:hypothetical protein
MNYVVDKKSNRPQDYKSSGARKTIILDRRITNIAEQDKIRENAKKD